MKLCYQHRLSGLLLLCWVVGCSGSTSTTGGDQSNRSEHPDTTKKKEVDPALAKSLEEAFRAYHKGMTSDDKVDHVKALAAWLGNADDVKALFVKYPTTPGFYAATLSGTLEGDVEEYAAGEKHRGDIKALEAVDVRMAFTPVSVVVGVTPEEVPIFLLRVRYEKEASSVSFGPIFYVNGRWASMPGLERMAPLFKEAKQ